MTSVQQLRKLTASQGLRSSVLMIFGNVFAQGMSGIAIILLSRLLGPSEFGIFSTGFALALIIASLIDFGLTAAQQQAIPRAQSDDARNTIFGTAIWIKRTLFIGVALVALPLSPLISEKLHFSSSMVFFWITLANVGSIFFNQLIAMLLSIKRISQTIISNSAQAVVKLALVGVVFVYSIQSGATILLIYLLLPLVILPFSQALLPKWYQWMAKINPASWLAMKGMALNNWVASIGSVLIQNADIVLVSMLMTQSEAGLIGAASRLAMFIALIGGSLSAVLNPRVATYVTQKDLSSYWRKAVLLLLGSVVLSISSFVLAAPLIDLTVGGQYAASADVLSWLLAASWLGVGLAPLTALFYSYNKPWYFSVSIAIQAGIILLGNVLLLPQFGIIAAGWTRLVAQLTMVLFTIGLALYTHRQRFHQLPQLWK